MRCRLRLRLVTRRRSSTPRASPSSQLRCSWCRRSTLRRLKPTRTPRLRRSALQPQRLRRGSRPGRRAPLRQKRAKPPAVLQLQLDRHRPPLDLLAPRLEVRAPHLPRPALPPLRLAMPIQPGSHLSPREMRLLLRAMRRRATGIRPLSLQPSRSRAAARRA